MHTSRLLLLLALVLLLTCAGCFPNRSAAPDREPAGFFMGVWHGWIAPISLIAGVFNANIRVYDPVNTGWWYDLGFYMAVIAGFGGIALTRNRKHDA